jgi:predicted transporter
VSSVTTQPSIGPLRRVLIIVGVAVVAIYLLMALAVMVKLVDTTSLTAQGITIFIVYLAVAVGFPGLLAKYKYQAKKWSAWRALRNALLISLGVSTCLAPFSIVVLMATW